MASTTKSALMLMLLLAAVVAAQAAGRTCKCRNSSPVPLHVNGVLLAVNAEADIVLLEAAANLRVVALDKFGHEQEGSCTVPTYVDEVELVYVDACIQVKVLRLIGGVIGAVLKVVGFVLLSLPCTLY